MKRIKDCISTIPRRDERKVTPSVWENVFAQLKRQPVRIGNWELSVAKIIFHYKMSEKVQEGGKGKSLNGEAQSGETRNDRSDGQTENGSCFTMEEVYIFAKTNLSNFDIAIFGRCFV